MPVLTVAIVIICIGVLLWAATRFIPMEANIKKLLVGFVVICTLLWVLGILGVWQAASKVKVPRVSQQLTLRV